MGNSGEPAALPEFFSRQIREARRFSPEFGAADGRSLGRRVRRVRILCGRLNSLDQVARECHVDRAYLCRLFRRYDRQTPYRFLTRQKMHLAAERLLDPGS